MEVFTVRTRQPFLNQTKMREYTIYFEFFGKRFKTTVFAESRDDAKQKVFDRVNFIRINEQPDDAMLEYLMKKIGITK